LAVALPAFQLTIIKTGKGNPKLSRTRLNSREFDHE
jgi:hypothetical protein